MLLTERERWGTRIGLILAMAGNAIGLGNFLRFPVQAAKNGGGAFLIPYFIALLLLGIPLMWIEWSIGRHGGKYGHGTTPGMFDRLWNHPMAKYVGALGVALPLLFVIYYTYIQSWTLAYSFFSITKRYFGILDFESMTSFLRSYQGLESTGYFGNILTAFVFFLITLGLNIFVLSHGIAKGIEKLAKIAMPLLFIFALALVVRVFTLGAPDPVNAPENSVLAGLGYLWNPDFTKLGSGTVWLAAAGQIFFTLSIGTGAIQTYASYLREKDDIVLTGLTTSITNEFAEIVCGASIAIPVAVAFFGLTQTQAIAEGGAFNLGFMAMPVIFQKLPLGELFGFMWFLLLFFAGITSSVALSQPMMAFLQEEFKLTRKQSAVLLGFIILATVQPIIFFLGHGYLDEIDFWVGTFGLVVFALIEVIIFVWIFGMDKAWKEMHQGAQIRIPRVYYYIMKYITPLYLIIILFAWVYQDLTGDTSYILVRGKPEADIPYIWMSRLFMLITTGIIVYLVGASWKKRKEEGKPP